MSKLINNAGVQRFANKLCDANNRKVGSKSLPTALNDIDTLIEQMKSHFANEYGTPLNMVLENDKNIFSVGSANGIDRRSDVKNSFTDIQLYGNSLVNLALFPDNKKGNLFADESVIAGGGNFECPLSCGLKANTTYTVIIKYFDLLLSGVSQYSFYDTLWYNDKTSQQFHHTINSNGIHKRVIRPTKNTQAKYVFNRGLVNYEGGKKPSVKVQWLIILEGDWTNTPIREYFQGMKSLGHNNGRDYGTDILSSNNGNIIVDPIYKTGFYVKHSNGGEVALATFSCTNYIEIEPLKKIRVLRTNKNIAFYDKNKINIPVFLDQITGIDSDFTITTPPNTKYVRFSIDNMMLGTEACYYGEDVGDINKKIEFDKRHITLNEPLRGLPNGVRDSIEKINGEWKIVRRCVEVTLNGDETPWWKNTDFDGPDTLFFYIGTKHSQSLPTGKVKSSSGSIHIHCDSFPCQMLKDRVNNKHNSIEGIYYSDAVNALIQFHINKSRLSSTSIQAFKDWLSKNPVKVIYELETYIIEDIDPLTIQCWKDGIIMIDGPIPVKTTHSVALNKPAQIKKNIEELTDLKNRVLDLENLLETTSLEHSAQLQLLNQSIKLDK